MQGGLTRGVMLGGVLVALASCAPGGGQQGAMGGLFNPFSGPFDPDMRGAMGAPFHTADAGAAATAATGPLGTPPAAAAPASAAPAPAAAAAAAPAAVRSHTVTAGETAWSIARSNGISVEALAQANDLGEGMVLRIGQVLRIPRATSAATSEAVSAPGAGSPTPLPPSAAQPLPRENTPPVGAVPPGQPNIDLGATRTAASTGGKLRMPVDGPIVRTYAKGSNDGIDITAAAGVPVKAAGSGTVAAITRDTHDRPIVVIRHEGSLMTVYTGLGSLSVSKGDRVSAGQAIGTAGSEGSVHFEVRNGFESADPAGYLG